MTDFFNTCLQSAKDYSLMMSQLAREGQFALNRCHSSQASYNLADLVKILEIFLKDFDNVDLQSLEKKLNDMKDPETLVFSNFVDHGFTFVAIDIKPKYERNWFGLGPLKRTHFSTHLVETKVSFKSKDKFLKEVENFVNFEF